LSSFLLIFFAAQLQLSPGTPTLTVAAASDLATLEQPLQTAFEKTNPNRIRWVTGASAILAQQIENGAPYDVFLSANAQFVESLAEKRKIEPKSVKAYATGRIGLLWRDGKPHEVKDLSENWVRFVALPNPDLAPYGLAARQALEKIGIWAAVRPKAVYGENVRQTLQLFESGNADAVLTSASLLQGKSAQIIPADLHPPIRQEAGIVSGSRNPVAAARFLQFLSSAAAQSVFGRYGFGKPAR
jgi:molybdate transport system substrate-binding protein